MSTIRDEMFMRMWAICYRLATPSERRTMEVLLRRLALSNKIDPQEVSSSVSRPYHATGQPVPYKDPHWADPKDE